MRICTIPGGQATIRERQDVTVGQRHAIQGALSRAVASTLALSTSARSDLNAADSGTRRLEDITLSPDDVDAIDAFREANDHLQAVAIINLVASWTLGQPLPTLDSIDGLNGDLYDALAVAIAEGGDLAELVQPTDFQATKRPDSTVPFGGSKSSGTGSRAVAPRSPTPRSSD